MNKLKKKTERTELFSVKTYLLLFAALFFLHPAFSVANAETLSLDKPLVIRWKSNIRNLSLISNNENVITVEENRNLAFISQMDGKIIWRLNLGADIFIRPIIDSSSIITFTNISNDSYAATTVRAVNIETGTTVWKTELADAVSDSYTNIELPYLICLLKNSGLIKISKKTGEIIETDPFTLDKGSIKILNESLLFFITDDFLTAYQLNPKKVIWEMGLQINSSVTPLVQNNNLYFITKSDYLLAINLFTGKTLWKKKVAKNIQSIAFANSSLLISTSENYIHSISPQGKFKWKKLLDGRPTNNFLIFRNSLLIFPVGSNNGVVLDMTKGKTLNKILLDDSEYVVAPPVVSGNYLLLQTQKGLTAYSNE